MTTTTIQQAVEAIRQEQRRATQGEWRSDYQRVEATHSQHGFQIQVAETKLLPKYSDLHADAKYIANTCSPDSGHLSRALHAVEILAEALSAYAELRPGCFGGEKMLVHDCRSLAHDALAQAATVLAGDGEAV